MTSREVTKHIGIPARNLLNWRNSDKNDWRYKLLMFLENKALTPDMVEQALTQLPEINQPEPDSISDLVEQIKTLQEQVQELQGSKDATVRSKPRKV